MRFILLCALVANVLTAGAQSLCENGFAGEYPCNNVDLQSVFTLAEVGGGDNGNDCWGWVSDGREFAIYGRSNGTAFIEITDPVNPVYLGNLATHTVSSLWRDIKVFDNHAFIVSEAPDHGMQVFDLTRLLNVENPPVQFDADAHYGNFGNAHNIAINETTGFAYAIGSNTFDGGLHIVNINDPVNPVIAGDFAEDGYTHDVQVVIYNGPDTEYQGKEIAFAANEDFVTIVDVEDKLNCSMISTITYDEVSYTHQGWLTEDHRYFLVNDELDEIQFLVPTRTYIFDVQDLDNPQLVGFYSGPVSATDHNLYVKGTLCYQANYRSGLRIVNIDGAGENDLYETGFFDTNPLNNIPGFNGAWSTYPYFPSGNVIISTFTHFFVVRPTEAVLNTSNLDEELNGFSIYPNPASDFAIIKSASPLHASEVTITDLNGRSIRPEILPSDNRNSVRINTTSLESGLYIVRIKGSATIQKLIIH
jgi:choice-of-anchor B domain-containing protein